MRDAPSSVTRVIPLSRDAQEEILSQSAHTRVFRRPVADGYVICKEALGPNAVQRLRHEQRILERLAGIPGVPQLAATSVSATVITLQDRPFVTLAVAMRAGLDVPQLLFIALQLARIVAAVHRAGVIHKDINPGNIVLCDAAATPMLLDYDLAATGGEERPAFIPANEIAGTLAYIAPEQTGRTGRAVDQRADLYALGATLYELAVGRRPFLADDPLQLIHDQLARVPTAPVEHAPLIPQGLSDIILHLLEKEPDQRYQSAEGLAHDLTRLREAVIHGDNASFTLGERDFPLRLSPPSRLVGRDEEIAALQDAFDRALHRSTCVFVVGAAGVGKSALINELRPIVAARGGLFAVGKFDKYRVDVGRGAVSQAMRALTRLLLAEPEAELAMYRERILKALGSNAGLSAAVNPEMALLLGVDPEPASGDPREILMRMRLGGVDQLCAIASPSRPLVMVLEDLQWADERALRFIGAILTDVRLRGLLLVCTYREAEVDADHPLTANLARWQQLGVAPLQLQLGNLLPGDLATLLAEMLRLPRAAATNLAHAVGARTHGNPYDTVELVNALRREGLLVAGDEGWTWDEANIRRYVGEGEVVDLLAVRIARMPQATQALLEILACLGGEIELDLLQAVSGSSAVATEEQIAPALEDGLLVMARGSQVNSDNALRFRHERVQQAVRGRLDTSRTSALRLDLARRLAAHPEGGTLAAQLYLAVIHEVRDPAECSRVIGLFHAVATNARVMSDHATTERYAAAALALLKVLGAMADASLLTELEIELHAALYSLGRLPEADEIYQSIERRCGDPLVLVAAACVQANSLCNRKRNQEAMTLGVSLLRKFGVEVPEQDLAADVARQLEALYRWVDTMDEVADLQRAEATHPHVLAVASLLNRMVVPAYYCDPLIMAWLVLEARRLWAEEGPCASLAGSLGYTGLITIALQQDYRVGYQVARHVLAAADARAYEPEASQGYFLFAFFTSHWFEPLENAIQQSQRACAGLLRGGDFRNACFSYSISSTALLECAPTLDSFAAEIESVLALALRTGNDAANDFSFPHRQLLRALRGQTDAPGSFAASSFDEAAHLAGINGNPAATGVFHVYGALAAALFCDRAGLEQHAAEAIALGRFIQGFYISALAHLLHALSVAQRIRDTAPEERSALLVEFDICHDWLAARAVDAPVNFLHMVRWIEAERAWAVGDEMAAARAFDAALIEVESRARPWHNALMTERAGLCHLASGMQRTGRHLLTEARRLYEAWGASAKVQQLETTHSFLRAVAGVRRVQDSRDARLNVGVSGDDIDLLGVLRASQMLSSETSLERLKVRVVELLGEITGATTVQLILRQDESQGWFLATTADETVVPVEAAGTRGLMPLSVFRYAERTREPLLVEDARRDDRFARDPYFTGLAHCSLLAVPILSQGTLCAVLMLENRLSRGAFSAQRLDAVRLVAGQLAVSLENALLYEELELRVQQRTQELRQTQAELVTTARLAGMAEVASNVLHNVGNVLNSVNVSANLVTESLQRSRVSSVAKVVELLREHAHDLAEFMTDDPKGRHLPGFLAQLCEHLLAEQRESVKELYLLRKNVDHIKEIVAMQQSFSKISGVREVVNVVDLVEDTIRMNGDALLRHGVAVIREFAAVPTLNIEKHKILQILVNLVRNAQYACTESGRADKCVTLQIAQDNESIRIAVIDNGVGIAPENLTRIFNHGFTTRKDGHGFGLHSGALAARELGGSLRVHSPGTGLGASFTLELPLQGVEAFHA